MGLFKKIGKFFSEGFKEAVGGVGEFVLKDVLDRALGLVSFPDGDQVDPQNLDAETLSALLEAAQDQGTYGLPQKEKTDPSLVPSIGEAVGLGDLPGLISMSQNTMGDLPGFDPLSETTMSGPISSSSDTLKRLLGDQQKPQQMFF